MPETKRLFLTNSRYYWHLLRYTKKAPNKEPCWTTEFGKPFRNGVGIARKIPGTNTAIVLGKWVGKEKQAQKIVENEIHSCEHQMDRVERELHRIIGPNTQVEKYG